MDNGLQSLFQTIKSRDLVQLKPTENTGFLLLFNNFSSGINYRFYFISFSTLGFYFVFVLTIIFVLFSVSVNRKFIIFVSVFISVHENISAEVACSSWMGAQ